MQHHKYELGEDGRTRKLSGTINQKRVKTAQIGIGHNNAQGKMEALRKLTDIFEIVVVAESDSQWMNTRGKLECYSGLRWMTE